MDLLSDIDTLQSQPRSKVIKSSIDDKLNEFLKRDALLDENELIYAWKVFGKRRLVSRHLLRLVPLLRPKTVVPSQVLLTILSIFQSRIKLKLSVRNCLLRYLLQTHEWWTAGARTVIDRLWKVLWSFVVDEGSGIEEGEGARRLAIQVIWLVTRKEHITQRVFIQLMKLRQQAWEDKAIDLLLRLFVTYLPSPSSVQFDNPPPQALPPIFLYPDPGWREAIMKLRKSSSDEQDMNMVKDLLNFIPDLLFDENGVVSYDNAVLRIVHGYRTNSTIPLRIKHYFADRIYIYTRLNSLVERDNVVSLLLTLSKTHGNLFEELEEVVSVVWNASQDFWDIKSLEFLPLFRCMPFERLNTLFLQRIRQTIKRGNLKYKIQVLEAMTLTIVHWATDLNSSRGDEAGGKIVDIEVLDELALSIASLALIMSTEHPHSLRLRFTTLSFYSTISHLPFRFNLPIILVLPTSLAYSSLSSDIAQMSIFLRTLNRMKTTFQSEKIELRSRQQALVGKFNGLLSASIDGLWRDKMWCKIQGKMYPPIATSEEIDMVEEILAERGQSGEVVLTVVGSIVYLSLVNLFVNDVKAKQQIDFAGQHDRLTVVSKETLWEWTSVDGVEKTLTHRQFKLAFVHWLQATKKLGATQEFCASIIKQWSKYRTEVEGVFVF